jgi:diguanylate cyclase (GGDEF)-like protein
MLWIAVILIVQCLVLGLMGWFVFLRNDSTIQRMLTVSEEPEQDIGLDSVRVCDLLATAGRALSDHSEQLCCFERSLCTEEAERPEFSSLGEIQQANQHVEHTIDTTIAGLMAACGDLLSEEQSSLEAYRDKNSAFGSTLDSIKHVESLVQFAGTLLDMVRELRTENKTVRDEVSIGQEKIIQLVTQASSAEQIARVDSLTQLSNRRAFDESHAECEEKREQSGQPYSLIILDIDHFKSVNDKYGHAAGDGVLSLVARILSENSKTSDHVCRLGGEEFGVLLPRCEEIAARSVAEGYRHHIESAKLSYGKHEISVTVSCGVAQAIPSTSKSDLLERADAALYAAKTRGRNQTCADGNLDEERQEVTVAN